MRTTTKEKPTNRRPNANETMLRQFTMLKKIPRGSRTGISVKELVDALENENYSVSTRTVERDLNDLSKIFTLECNDKSKPYGWRWKKNADISLAEPSVTESLTFTLVADYLKPLLPKPFFSDFNSIITASKRVLNYHQKSSKSVANWTQKIRVVHPFLNTSPPKINELNLEKIQMALLGDRQIKVIYQNITTHEEKELTLHPLALIQRGPTSYIVATAFTYTDVRLFAIQRFKKVSILEDEKANRPKNFDIDTYIKEGHLNFGEGKPTEIKLKLAIKNHAITLLQESPLSDDMTLKMTSDLGAKYPTATVEATVPDTWQLSWWLLSQVDTVTVLQPASLRKKITAQLENALKNYAQK